MRRGGGGGGGGDLEEEESMYEGLNGVASFGQLQCLELHVYMLFYLLFFFNVCRKLLDNFEEMKRQFCEVFIL